MVIDHSRIYKTYQDSQHEDDDSMPSYADKHLLGDLHCIVNQRCALGFPADVLGLHDACTQHGAPPELLDDNEHCFGWLVSHLFRGDLEPIWEW